MHGAAGIGYSVFGMNVDRTVIVAALIALWLFRSFRWTVRRLIAKPA